MPLSILKLFGVLGEGVESSVEVLFFLIRSLLLGTVVVPSSSSELEESSKLDLFFVTFLFPLVGESTFEPSESSRDRKVLKTGDGGSFEDGESESIEGILFFKGELKLGLLSMFPIDLFNGPG